MPEQDTSAMQEVPVLKTRLDQLDKSLADSNKRMESGFREVEERLSQFERNIIGRLDSQRREKRSAWGWIVTACGSVGVAVCVAMWGAIKMQTDGTVSPIRSDVTYLLTTVSQLRSDRDSSIDKVADLNRQYAKSEAERKAKEREIETQFDAMDQIRNVQFANNERMLSIMWNSIDGLGGRMGKFPSEGPWVMPNISRKAVDGQ